jgi:multidrug efflux pump subunit AcrB
MIVTLAMFIFAILMPITGIVPTEFFPPSDQGMIYVTLKAPTGLNLKNTDEITRKVEEHLMNYPEISNFSTQVGTGGSGGGINGGVGVSSGSSNLASITVNLVDKKERKIKSYDLATKIRDELKYIKEAEITVETPSAGPPSGSSFEARITGDDLQQLDKIANDLKPYLSSIPGVVNTDTSLKESPAEYTFELDPVRLEFYNLNAAYVGSALRMAISGVEATKVIINGKEIKVMARFDKDRIPNLQSIQNLQILNLRKQPVFLKDVAKIDLNPSVNSITRIDQKRTILLSAGVEGKTRPNAVLTEFKSKVAKGYKMPSGYNIIYGGENEQNNESVYSILRAMVIAGILIISTLIIQFNSLKKAMIVLVAIPLALIGVFLGMAIARVTLSFPGLIGILALFGIVVKNSIILIDKMNLNLKFGIPFKEAVIDAGKSRLEAIFITSICTIFGIIPVTLSNETWMALGSVVIFGLMLSSFFTLFLVPVMFVAFIDEKQRL